MSEKKIVCVITCYKNPDYIRAKSIRAALSNRKDTEVVVVKNSKKGIVRYFEVIAKVVSVRFKRHPDIYILTFRGYELLPIIRLITFGKKFVFDEFINLVEWVVYEHNKVRPNSFIYRILYIWYRFWLKSSDLILADTVSHAKYSSKLMKIPMKKYLSLIVSTDEETFKATKAKQSKGLFKVFYYGSMLPLHGVDIVIEAMKLLRAKNISLTLIGGDDKTKQMIEDAIESGSKIEYKKWVNFEELPKYIQDSNVCLAGPFGGTVQSRYVITGKAYQFLQMKRPIIIGKNQESHIFKDKQNALIVDQASAKALAKTIEWAYDNQKKLAGIGEAGYQLYQEKLSNKVLGVQIEELFKRLGFVENR
ncbi:MAG: glycosyltransferase [Candidatus Saccharimonadales bacterium]